VGRHGIQLIGISAGTTVEGGSSAVWRRVELGLLRKSDRGSANWLEFAWPRRSDWFEEFWIAAPSIRVIAP
jgi:hypothetical protein